VFGREFTQAQGIWQSTQSTCAFSCGFMYLTASITRTLPGQMFCNLQKKYSEVSCKGLQFLKLDSS